MSDENEGLHSDWLKERNVDRLRSALARHPLWVDKACSNMNYPPVIVASAWGSVNCLQVLIKRGASVGPRCLDGNTALICAARNNQEECARMLLEAGADPGHKNNAGYTALDLAGSGGHEACCALLKAALSEQAMEAPWKQSFKLMR